MFNVDETFALIKIYRAQQDIFLKFICYCTCIIVVVETIRQTVPEINLLQLVPGFYLLLVFSSLFFILGFSILFNQLPIFLETRRRFGIRSASRPQLYRLGNFSLFFLFSLAIFSYNTIVPNSLDSFNSYGEKTLENLWSFAEVLALEINLFLLLIILSQAPIIGLFYLETELNFLLFPKIWRYVAVGIVTISGFLTPTVDGLTQVNFALVSLFFYFLIFFLVEKRNTTKLKGTSIVGS
jgi:hypothetical protein